MSAIIAATCTYLASPGVTPISASEFRDLADRAGGPAALALLPPHKIPALDRKNERRLAALLSRLPTVEEELVRMSKRGIGLLTLADDGYPSKLTDRLGAKAPPALFTAGDISLLRAPGVAVVGSRDVSEEGEAFARELGAACASADLALVSGAARGVDSLAMLGSLQAGGRAVGILANSLTQAVRRADLRAAIEDRVLLLLTPFSPSAPFNAGNAMARNKLIYCLAEYAVAVESSLEKGGTWAGAIENLKAGWVPLLARPGTPGTDALIIHGATPLLTVPSAEELPAALAKAARPTGSQPGLF